MDEVIKTYMPQMLTGYKLDEALRIEPEYDKSIMMATEAERLIGLQDLYSVYIPTDMSHEIYSKLYLALLRSMSKKQSLKAIRQFSENQNCIKGKEFSAIIGGSDSFTIIGDSGIGKSATISRVIDLISMNRVIDLPNSMRIIPAVQVQTPADCSIKGLLYEVLRKIDEILDTRYHYNAIRVGSTTDMLLGSTSQATLNHVGLLVVDEIQNVVNSKNGAVIVGMLTQLINNSGISICMVGTPKSALFFGQEMMLARRSLGLSYTSFSYDDTFRDFCTELFQYQYVQNKTTLDESILQWLYNHSRGNASIVVSLIHDAQEMAILDGYERLDIASLEKAYKSRLAMLHDYLYQEPVQGKKVSAKKNTGATTAGTKDGEQNLITSVVTRAKKLQKNIVDELIYYGIEISEVAV